MFKETSVSRRAFLTGVAGVVAVPSFVRAAASDSEVPLIAKKVEKLEAQVIALRAAAGTREQADSDDDHKVSRGDERDKRRVRKAAADHQVDVVQAVAENRHADR